MSPRFGNINLTCNDSYLDQSDSESDSADLPDEMNEDKRLVPTSILKTTVNLSQPASKKRYGHLELKEKWLLRNHSYQYPNYAQCPHQFESVKIKLRQTDSKLDELETQASTQISILSPIKLSHLLLKLNQTEPCEMPPQSEHWESFKHDKLAIRIFNQMIEARNSGLPELFSDDEGPLQRAIK